MKPLANFTALPIPTAYNASNFVPPLPIATFEDSANPAQQKLDEISGEIESRNNPAYVAGRLLLDAYAWATRRNLDRHEIYGKFARAYAEGKPEEARKHISRYIKRLDQLSSGDNPEWFLKDQYEAGNTCYRRRFYPEAIDAFSRVISRLLSLKQDDENRGPGLSLLKESYQFRVHTYSEIGKYEEALEDVEKLIEIDPSNPSYIQNSGLLRMRLGDYSRARDDFSKVIEIAHPKSGEFGFAHIERARCNRELGDYEESFADYDVAIGLDRNNRLAVKERKQFSEFVSGLKVESGRKLRETDLPNSLRLLNEAIELDPENALAFFERGAAHDLAKRSDKAVDDYRKFLELLELGFASKDLLAIAISRKAEAGFRRFSDSREGYEEVMQDFKKLIEIDPSPTHIYRKGFIEYALGHYSEARDDFSKVIEIADDNTLEYKFAYEGRAYCNWMLGDYEQSIADYDAVIRMDPNNSKIAEEFKAVVSAQFEAMQADVKASPFMMAAVILIACLCGAHAFDIMRKSIRKSGQEGPEFRPDNEAEKAIRGFARSVTDLLIEKADLTPEQKESFLALTLEKAEELFSKVVGVEVGEDLNRKVEEVLSGVTENEEMRGILLDQLKSVQEQKRVQTLLVRGVSIEKNFIYDQALPQNVMHRRLDPEKLTWAFGIFEDEVKKSLVKIHQEVQREEVGEVLEGLLGKVSAKQVIQSCEEKTRGG